MKPKKYLEPFKITIISILALAGILIASTVNISSHNCPTLKSLEKNTSLSKFIAHAGGGYEGLTYTNSLEALNYNYHQRHYKFFEVDISKTTDRKLVLIHDWDETLKKYFSSITPPLTYQKFITKRMNYGLTQIDLESLFNWLKDKKDVRLITDIKTDNIAALKEIASSYSDYLPQIIPQIYSFDEYEQVKTLGYENIILTLYRLKISDEEILTFAKNNKLLAVTMPTARGKTKLPKKLLKLEVPTLVHTVNTEMEARQLKNNCVFGFYTDFLFSND